MNGSVHSKSFLPALSGFKITAPVVTHKDDTDVRIMLGMLFCIGQAHEDLRRLEAFFNLVYQPDSLAGELKAEDIAMTFYTKFISNQYGIFYTFEKVWKAFRFYFPVPAHMINPTLKLFNILPKIGTNNSGDFTNDAYYDSTFGWIYPMNVTNDSGPYPVLALEYFLIAASSSLEPFYTTYDLGEQVSLFAERETYYTVIPSNVPNFLKLNGFDGNSVMCPINVVFPHVFEASKSFMGNVVTKDLRLLDRVTWGAGDDMIHGVLAEIGKSVPQVFDNLFYDLPDTYTAVTKDSPRFQYGDIVSCVHYTPFTEGTIVQIRNQILKIDDIPRKNYYEYAVQTDIGCIFYPEELLFYAAIGDTYTPWFFEAPDPIRVLPENKKGVKSFQLEKFLFKPLPEKALPAMAGVGGGLRFRGGPSWGDTMDYERAASALQRDLQALRMNAPEIAGNASVELTELTQKFTMDFATDLGELGQFTEIAGPVGIVAGGPRCRRLRA